MIQIVQAGQAGKTKYLLDMHRLRARVFKERMGWNVNVDMQGLEVDDFDIPEAIYLLSCDESNKVVGCWRIIPTNLPTMIETVWPKFLTDIDLRKNEDAWEMSRFAVNLDASFSAKEGLSNLNKTTAKMFCALTELCILCNIQEIYTLYDLRISRILKRLNCIPFRESRPMKIDGNDCFVGHFIPDGVMLSKLKEAANIQENFISKNDLPPSLMTKISMKRKNTTQKEKIHEHAG